MIDAKTAQQRLLTMLEASKPPTGGVELDTIAREAAPLLPLLAELPPEALASGDYESFQFRECLTVMTLLGRRLALLDLTPTAAVQVMQLALRIADRDQQPSAHGFSQRAVAALIEGFVLGREEHVLEEHERRSSKHLAPIRVDEDVYALILSGTHEPTTLLELVDALGRAMLDSGVEIAIVDLSQLGEANRDRASAMLSADEVARFLGGACVFSGIDGRWTAAIDDAGISLDPLLVAPTFAEALTTARHLASRRPQATISRWRQLLSRLPGGKRGLSPFRRG
ncbi:MAG: hypothetical protein WBG86_13100, partial [Polyangiales bacterium]